MSSDVHIEHTPHGVVAWFFEEQNRHRVMCPVEMASGRRGVWADGVQGDRIPGRTTGEMKRRRWRFYATVAEATAAATAALPLVLFLPPIAPSY